MSRPLPLPVWDRRSGTLFDEFMDDHPATYESRPHRSLNQWLESHPLYDWLLAAYQNTKHSARQIKPHPAFDYNIGRREDRMEHFNEAIAAYQAYLAAVPAAAVPTPDSHLLTNDQIIEMVREKAARSGR